MVGIRYVFEVTRLCPRPPVSGLENSDWPNIRNISSKNTFEAKFGKGGSVSVVGSPSGA